MEFWIHGYQHTPSGLANNQPIHRAFDQEQGSTRTAYYSLAGPERPSKSLLVVGGNFAAGRTSFNDRRCVIYFWKLRNIPAKRSERPL